MSGKLWPFGTALAIGLAVSAVVASGAAAQEGRLTVEPVPGATLVASEAEEGANFLEAFSVKVKCPGSTITGHEQGETPHALVPSGATAVTLTPDYVQESCLAAGAFPATVEMNGCDYSLHVGETTGGEGTYGATVDVVCPAEKEIAITIFTTKEEDPATPFCTYRIKEQLGLKGLHVTDPGNGHLDVTGTLEGIHVTRTSHGAHGLLCPNNTSTNTAKFIINMTMTGHDDVGDPTGIALSDE